MKFIKDNIGIIVVAVAVLAVITFSKVRKLENPSVDTPTE